MSDCWCRRRLVKENEYFSKQCKDAVEKIRVGTSHPISPVTGEPLVHSLYRNVEVLRDPKTGGVWLNEEKLEELLNAAAEGPKRKNWTDALRFELT